MIELCHRLRKRGYTRCPESLFRVMRRLGVFSEPKQKKAYTPKPYEQMQYPGQHVQVDVKVVPRKCITDIAFVGALRFGKVVGHTWDVSILVSKHEIPNLKATRIVKWQNS